MASANHGSPEKKYPGAKGDKSSNKSSLPKHQSFFQPETHHYPGTDQGRGQSKDVERSCHQGYLFRGNSADSVEAQLLLYP
jgi:hypothetical protein